ncbi:MAG: hypothetical protein QNJ74_14725 [Trichodesmium sp. MO_231.B1]|nr:hypothetical protein [Trichodesmium sp. MO_231.B1]
MKLTEIRQKGYKALIDSLGVVGMLRFIQELDAGSGDYTKEKYQLEEPTLEEFEEFVRQQNLHIQGAKIKYITRYTYLYLY